MSNGTGFAAIGVNHPQIEGTASVTVDGTEIATLDTGDVFSRRSSKFLKRLIFLSQHFCSCCANVANAESEN